MLKLNSVHDLVDSLIKQLEEQDRSILSQIVDEIGKAEKRKAEISLKSIENQLFHNEPLSTILRNGMTALDDDTTEFDLLFSAYVSDVSRKLHQHARAEAIQLMTNFEQLKKDFLDHSDKYLTALKLDNEMKNLHESRFFLSRWWNRKEGVVTDIKKTRARLDTIQFLKQLFFPILKENLKKMAVTDPLYREKTDLLNKLNAGTQEDIWSILPGLSRSPLFHGEESWLSLGVPQRLVFGKCVGSIQSASARFLQVSQ